MKRFVVVFALLALAVAAPAQAKLRPADRAAVNQLLDKFIPSVVAGKDLKAGRALVGGYVTVGTIQRYPAEGTTFHGWILNYATPGDVGFDVLVQPVNKHKIGPWSFRGEAQKVNGRWIITDWYPVAQFQPVGKAAWVNGPNDLSPSARGGLGVKDTGKWLYVPFIAFACLLFFVAAWVVTHWLRTRSKVRAIERLLASSR